MVRGSRVHVQRASARAFPPCSTRAKHITPGRRWKDIGSIPAFSKLEIRIKNASESRGAHDARQKSFRRRSSSLPVYLYFTNRFQKERNTLGLSGTAQSARRREGRGKKTKKIIIKMSHRESPMSRESERKKKKKKKFGNIIKIRWKPPPPPPLRPPSPPPPTRFPYPLFEFRGIPLGYLGRTARTQTSIRSYSTRVERICHLVPSGFRLVK